MSQVTDYIIANDTGANVRSDINAVLGAIQTLNSGSSDPSANVAFQLSVNTTSNLLKIRNAANNGYITIGNVTQANLGLAALAGAKAITFDKAFFTGTSALNGVNSSLPSIGITAQNMASGDYFEVTSVSGTGFTVHFKNSSNASISRNFNYSAVGFGKGA